MLKTIGIMLVAISALGADAPVPMSKETAVKLLRAQHTVDTLNGNIANISSQCQSALAQYSTQSIAAQKAYDKDVSDELKAAGLDPANWHANIDKLQFEPVEKKK